MNRKKKTVKKMTFEPKTPSTQIEEVKPDDIPITTHTDTQLVKGKFPPIQLLPIQSVYKYNPKDNLIINIPYSSNNIQLVVFEDDTCGLRIDNNILLCDAIQVDSDTVVEESDNIINKVSTVNYYLVPRDVIKSEVFN